jgi:hypothetical protein
MDSHRLRGLMKNLIAIASILLGISPLCARPNGNLQTNIKPDIKHCDAVNVAKTEIKKRYYDFKSSMVDFVVIDRFGKYLIVNITLKNSMYNGATIAIKESDCKFFEFYWGEP